MRESLMAYQEEIDADNDKAREVCKALMQDIEQEFKMIRMNHPDSNLILVKVDNVIAEGMDDRIGMRLLTCLLRCTFRTHPSFPSWKPTLAYGRSRDPNDEWLVGLY